MLTDATLGGMTDTHDLAALLNSRRGALERTMGIEYLEAGTSRGAARMPVEGNTQPIGFLHGGATVVLAESLGSMIASIYAHPNVAFGTEVSATHHRAVTSGFVTATCVPLYEGRSTATYEIAITDDDDRRIATARLTCALRPTPKGADPLGGL